MRPEQIAQQTVDQWEKHDKFRQIAAETGFSGTEPADVIVAKAYLDLVQRIKSVHQIELWELGFWNNEKINHGLTTWYVE